MSQSTRAIDYLPDRTEEALKRMENSGQTMRTEEGRWTILITGLPNEMGTSLQRSGKNSSSAMEADLACP
jgi:hypothetical protein